MSLKVKKVKIGKREYQLVQMRALNESKRARIQVVRLNGTLWEEDVSLPKEQYNALKSCAALQPSLAGTENLYVAALMRPYESGKKLLFRTGEGGGVRFGIPAAGFNASQLGKGDPVSPTIPLEPFLPAATNDELALCIIRKLLKWKCSSTDHDDKVFSKLSVFSWVVLLAADKESPCHTSWVCQKCIKLPPSHNDGQTLTQFLIEHEGILSPWTELAAASTCSVCKSNPLLCNCNPIGCNSSTINCADILRLYLEEKEIKNDQS